MTWGKPFLWLTWSRPSSDLGMVTHSDKWALGEPEFWRAFSSTSIAPFFFFNFFTRAWHGFYLLFRLLWIVLTSLACSNPIPSIALSAHFSSSSPRRQPRRRFTAGVWNSELIFLERSHTLNDKFYFSGLFTLLSPRFERYVWRNMRTERAN